MATTDLALLPTAALEQLSPEEAEQALERLEQCRQALADRSLSENTRAAYLRDARDFIAWCHEHRLPFLPTTLEALQLYVTACAKGRDLYTFRTGPDGSLTISKKPGTLSPASIQRRLAAIVFLHRHALGEDTNIRQLTSHRSVLDLIRGHQRDHPPPTPRPALPAVAIAQLAHAPPPERTGRAAKLYGPKQEALQARDTALVVLGWIAGFRVSELAALRYEQIAPLPGDQDGYSITNLPAKSRSRSLALPKVHGHPLCPSTALERWLEHRSIRTADDHQAPGPLFHGFHPGFDPADPKPLTRRGLTKILKDIAGRAGIDSATFAPHDLRRSMASVALDSGASIADIKAMGGWSSSAALLAYLEQLPKPPAALANLLLKAS